MTIHPARGPGTTVSYLPIMPPKWALLPSDPLLYPSPAALREQGEYTFRLEHDSEAILMVPGVMFGTSPPRFSRIYDHVTCHVIVDFRRRSPNPALPLHKLRSQPVLTADPCPTYLSKFSTTSPKTLSLPLPLSCRCLIPSFQNTFRITLCLPGPA